ncbi:MAG: L-threonylcarbamoyladenylate synthase [bacterium]|nr:L-threonylcarbamoyladenylate synthase [bacterium]
MKIIDFNNSDAQIQALATLQQGGLVIYPTETVYGALVDATNKKAVQKLLNYKRRPTGKAISIACSNQKMAEEYVFLNEQARKIYSIFLPGTVPFITQKKKKTAPGLTNEKNTLGIRIPNHAFLLKLISDLGRPVTATSANSAGKKAPYSISDLLSHLSEKQKSQIDLIVDAGTLPKNPPSLVIDTTTSSPTIVRDNKNIQLEKTTAKVEKIWTDSDEETKKIADKILKQNFSQLEKTGLIIALDGPLGAGKTVFAQGLGESLQIKTNLTSPTYTYLKEYPYQLKKSTGVLYHLDVWTINEQNTFNLLEVEKLVRPNNLIVIEWFENIAQFFTPTSPLLKIKILPTKENIREITIIQL